MVILSKTDLQSAFIFSVGYGSASPEWFRGVGVFGIAILIAMLINVVHYHIGNIMGWNENTEDT